MTFDDKLTLKAKFTCVFFVVVFLAPDKTETEKNGKRINRENGIKGEVPQDPGCSGAEVISVA